MGKTYKKSEDWAEKTESRSAAEARSRRMKRWMMVDPEEDPAADDPISIKTEGVVGAGVEKPTRR